MMEDHGAQKPGYSPGPGPEVVETESPKSKWRKESVAGLCRMSVLGRVSAGAAGWTLDSVNSGEIRA